MVKLSFKSLALKWYFFTCVPACSVLLEYFYLFMKQLGFNSGQIALTTLFGVQHFLIPLCLMFGEKCRGRNVVAILGTLTQTVGCVLPLLIFVIPALQPSCHDISHVKPKELATLGYVSVNSKDANNSNNAFTSMIHKSKYDLAPTKTVLITATSTSAVSMFSESSSPTNVVYASPIPKIEDTSSYVRYKSAKTVEHKFGKNNPTVANLHKSIAELALSYSVSLRQNMSSNGLVRSRYLSHSKQLSSNQFQHVKSYTTASRSLAMQQSISMTSSLHSTNYTRTDNSNMIHHPQLILGALFALMTLSRAISQFCHHINLSLVNLATVTYLKEKRASYGGYYMWTHIGNAFSIACVAFLAWWIRIDICGIQKYGYYIAFIWAGVSMSLSIPSLHWFKFEYDKKKSFNLSSVISDVLNAHYILMFLMVFFTGICLAFQLSWEFWYLDGLSASPLLIAGAALIRRPLLAISMCTSSHLIRKIGDLNTVCVALFLYSVSFFALSFTRTAWFVLMIDTCQAAAYGFSYCAFVVVLHKASSKENSSMILGEY